MSVPPVPKIKSLEDDLFMSSFQIESPVFTNYLWLALFSHNEYPSGYWDLNKHEKGKLRRDVVRAIPRDVPWKEQIRLLWTLTHQMMEPPGLWYHFITKPARAEGKVKHWLSLIEQCEQDIENAENDESMKESRRNNIIRDRRSKIEDRQRRIAELPSEPVVGTKKELSLQEEQQAAKWSTMVEEDAEKVRKERRARENVQRRADHRVKVKRARRAREEDETAKAIIDARRAAGLNDDGSVG
jgi:hypothetical protein